MAAEGWRSGASLDRFNDPLYTVAEAARYLGVPDSTLQSWVHGYRYRDGERPEVSGEPVLTAIPSLFARGPVIPFVGLAEGLVLTAMRRSGVSLQRIRPALAPPRTSASSMRWLRNASSPMARKCYSTTRNMVRTPARRSQPRSSSSSAMAREFSTRSSRSTFDESRSARTVTPG